MRVSECAIFDAMQSFVTLAEIDRQRSLGWPDFGPETFCHRCGNRNIQSWCVDSDRFNLAMGKEHDWNGIICPSCFVQLHEEASGLISTWRLVPEMFQAGTWEELQGRDDA